VQPKPQGREEHLQRRKKSEKFQSLMASTFVRIVIAANGAALAMWRHSMFVLPMQMLINCTNVHCLFYCSTEFGHPGTMAD